MVNVMKKGLLLLLVSMSVNADSIPYTNINAYGEVVLNMPIVDNFGQFVRGSITLHPNSKYTVQAEPFICTGAQFDESIKQTDEWKWACGK